MGLTIRATAVGREPATQRRSSAEEALSAVVQACHKREVPALVAQVDGDIQVLLSIGKRASADAVAEQLASQISARQSLIIGAGRTATVPEAISRTLCEARQVVESVRPGEARELPRSPYRLVDVHIRGLLTLWADDDRLQLFVSRELTTSRPTTTNTNRTSPRPCAPCSSTRARPTRPPSSTSPAPRSTPDWHASNGTWGCGSTTSRSSPRCT